MIGSSLIMAYRPRRARPVRFDHQRNDFPSGPPHSVNKYILLTEHGRAGLGNIWLSVTQDVWPLLR